MRGRHRVHAQLVVDMLRISGHLNKLLPPTAGPETLLPEYPSLPEYMNMARKGKRGGGSGAGWTWMATASLRDGVRGSATLVNQGDCCTLIQVTGPVFWVLRTSVANLLHGPFPSNYHWRPATSPHSLSDGAIHHRKLLQQGARHQSLLHSHWSPLAPLTH